MRLLCFLTLSRKRHSITSAMFCWSHKPFLLQYVCVLVADVCVCGRGGGVATQKCPEVGIMATTSSKNYTIFTSFPKVLC